MGLGFRLGRDALLEAGAFFEGADFFEAGAAGGVAADKGLDYGGVGLDLDEGVPEKSLNTIDGKAFIVRSEFLKANITGG